MTRKSKSAKRPPSRPAARPESAAPAIQLPVAAAIGGVAAQALWDLVFAVVAVDPVHYAVFSREIAPPLPAPVFGMVLVLLAAALRFGGERPYAEKLAAFNRAAWPVLLLLPALVWFPCTYWTMLLTLLAGSVAVFRIALNVDWRGGPLRGRLSPRTGRWSILLLFAAGTAWGFYMQLRAFNTLFLLYQDWGEYASGYLKLAFGDGVRVIDFLVNAGHWNPLANLTMSAAIRIYPDEKTIFLINSLLIASAAPLVYQLARNFRLPVGAALLTGALALVNPVFSNQHLALFYGFHPIYFFIPVLLGFFIFKQRGSRAGMIAMFVVSLFIQETVLVFWAGYAVYLALCRRRYVRGAALFVFAAGAFYLLSSVVMPMAYDYTHYSQMFHYAHLGNSVPEVALAPVLRPAAFWGTLFSESNFLFAFALLLPFFPAVLPRPKLLIAILPLFAGVGLQSSRSLQTVALQYGTEITVVCFVAAIAGLASYRKPPGLWWKILGVGLPEPAPRRLFAGLLGAMLFATLGCYFCFGKSAVFGKYSFANIARLPDCSAAVAEVKKAIPADREVRTQLRLRGHFVFDYPTGKIELGSGRAHTVVLNLNDNFEGNLADVHRRLVTDPRYTPVHFTSAGRDHLVVFDFDPAGKRSAEPPLFIRAMTAEEFRAAGAPVESTDPHFEVAVRLDAKERVLQCFLRPIRPIDRDLDVGVALRRGDAAFHRVVPFGFGIYPAYQMRPGEVFILAVPLPPGWTGLDSAGVKLEPRR
jgi:hypothetical protein